MKESWHHNEWQNFLLSTTFNCDYPSVTSTSSISSLNEGGENRLRQGKWKLKNIFKILNSVKINLINFYKKFKNEADAGCESMKMLTWHYTVNDKRITNFFRTAFNHL